MKKLFVLAVSMAITGCAVSETSTRLTMDSLREYRAAREAQNAWNRITVTVNEPRVRELHHRDQPTEQRQALLDEMKMRGMVLADRHELRLLDHYPLPTLGLHAYVFEARDTARLDDLIPVLEREPQVERVQRMGLYRTQGSEGSELPSGDPLSALQAIPAEDLRQLHALATGRNVTVVIIDTGIDTGHEDLAGARLSARDMVDDRVSVPPEMHATAVAGLVLAQPDNGVGIRGFAPDANVIVLRACWQPLETEAAFCTSSTLAKALSAALVAEPDIVNLSLTGPMDPVLMELVAQLQQRNAIIVAANQDDRSQGPFPSMLPDVIAATGRPLLARDSDRIYAPGRDVISLLPDHRYGLHDGSSIAAAQVSGIISLFRERNPAITVAEVRAILRGDEDRPEGMPGLLEALRNH